MLAPLAILHRLMLGGRRLLPPQRCSAFGPGGQTARIEQIYVINLDRQPERWREMQRELERVLDAFGRALTARTIRFSAVDAAGFAKSPEEDAEINPFYTLRDQLYVEPQPSVLPDRFELDRQIGMSRPEIAVARSHIGVWRQIADGPASYSLVLEDDACFMRGFGRLVERAWNEILPACDGAARFDMLYLSYKEVKGGAQKAFLSPNVFRPVRGLWYLSGYVLSREGARKLLGLLPCRGPVDLWVNHQFDALDVRATRRSLVSQQSNAGSTNSYSILPTLGRMGLIDSAGESLFPVSARQRPVFAFGHEGSGLSALAMALSMLGYRCVSDLESIPQDELDRLLTGSTNLVFDAYVNIGSLNARAAALKDRHPDGKFIVTKSSGSRLSGDESFALDGISDDDVAVLPSDAADKWKVLCEHLRCAPPACSYPEIFDLGQRPLLDRSTRASPPTTVSQPRRDPSPWVANGCGVWRGIRAGPTKATTRTGALVRIDDSLDTIDSERWLVRDDTFPGNLGLFRPANVECRVGAGVALTVKQEPLGVRDYSAAALSSRDRFLFGRFETTLQPSKVSGVVTGFFLHRDSPRQEIDVEIVGRRTDQLLVNVFYNPGDEGAKMDYGYRGSPTLIDLGFDASDRPHNFAIEWVPDAIRWLVDGQLVHERFEWDPTPIPQLPMYLHINAWPSRSRALAGRLARRQLPATTLVDFIAVEAHRLIG